MPAPTDAPAFPASAPGAFQARFEQRWGHLTRPHVRALAWLLDAPDLLDPAAPQWGGNIASVGQLAVAPGQLAVATGQGDAGATLAAWLAALQHDPAPLEAALGGRVYSRLGLYAEKLMAFYFAEHGLLVAHGLQVRANRNDTVGEFDFLLRHGARLLHWEFATKFYLLAGPFADAGAAPLHALVGPNLADTLGIKIRKILDKQLALGQHPAAAALLPQPVDAAQALVKGWLFYPAGPVPRLDGIAALHNHGFWSALADLDAVPGVAFVIMPRLLWLAPLKARDVVVIPRAALAQALLAHFALAPAPLMLASVREEDGWAIELARGFVVPNGWLAEAAQRRAGGTLPL